MLNIQERENGNTIILDLEGDVILGGGSAKLREKFTELLQNNKNNILLNFGKVKYLDSSGSGEILAGLEGVKKAEGSLKITNLTPKVEQVLSLSNLMLVLDVYDDEAAALNS